MSITIPSFSFDYQHQLMEAELKAAFQEVLDGKWYILGKQCQQFEEAFAVYCNVPHAIGVANGLDALRISLMALNIGAGDEVIVPTNTFIATWLAVSYTGATIIPVEPNRNTYNITAELIAPLITNKTKAIIPVHLYGQPCQMDAIMDLAAQHNVAVIEDNAQAQGATCNGKITGSFGRINATSFYPVKNLGALGDGGAITTADATLARKARLLGNYGSEKKYEHEIIGLNSRLDELQAAFLAVKLKYLDGFNKQRQDIANLYNNGLAGLGDLILPQIAKGCKHVYHQYVIRTTERNALHEYLRNNGIHTQIHYPIPPHLQQAYQSLGYQPGDLPVAEELAQTSLSLPLYPGMAITDTKTVINAVASFYEKGFNS